MLKAVTKITALLALVLLINCEKAPTDDITEEPEITPISGDLDTTFAIKGVFTLTGEKKAFDVVIQNDSKIIVVGRSATDSPSMMSIRLSNDGTLDDTFGTNGVVLTSFGTGSGMALAASLQADGKIAVAGSWSDTDSDYVLVRYLTDGSLDNTFGISGTVRSGDLYDEFGQDVLVQPDGSVVVSGGYTGPSGSFFESRRYLADGSIDTSWGTSGVSLYNVTGSYEGNRRSALQSDGKIIQVGNVRGSNLDWAIVRFNSDGTLDGSFNGSGEIIVDFLGADGCMDVAIQNDGKILVGGTVQTGVGLYDFAVIRYNEDGTLDTSFGPNHDGISIVDVSHSDSLYTIKIASDNKILIGGAIENGTVIVRLISDGTIDTSFATNGIRQFDSSDLHDIRAITEQEDGKIIAVGGNKILRIIP